MPIRIIRKAFLTCFSFLGLFLIFLTQGNCAVFNVKLGQDTTFTTSNYNFKETKVAPYNPNQGAPVILQATVEDWTATAHVLAEQFQEGYATSRVGVEFLVMPSPSGIQALEAEITVKINYALDVNFPCGEGGGSADNMVQIFANGNYKIDNIGFVHYPNSGHKGREVTRSYKVMMHPGDNYIVFSSVYAHCDIYSEGYGDSFARTTIQEIKVTFSSLGKPQDPNALVGKDPINVVSGNVYSSHQDISIPVRRELPLEFIRTYNGQDDHTGSLGYGWTHNYNVNIIENSDGSVMLMNEDGRHLWFSLLPTGSYQHPKGEYSQLTKNSDSTYLLTRKHGQKLYFNSQGLLDKIEGRNSNFTEILRDTNGLIQEVTDPSGRKLIFSYDSQNRISEIKDPAQRIFKYEYDSIGNLIKAIDPLNHETLYQYDANHNLTQITDSNNHSTYFAYDGEDRVYSTWQDGENNAVTLAFDPDNQATTLTNSLGNTTRYQYNEYGLITKITDSQNKTQCFGWDSNLNRNSITDPNGNTTNFTYDSRGNLLTLKDAFNNTSTFTYEPSFDLLSSFIDPLGSKTEYLYDARGNLVQVKDALNNVTSYTYNVKGELIQSKDARDNITNFTYDTYGNLIQVVDALNNPTGFTYDILSNLLRSTNALGNPVNFTYDLLNRLVQVTYPDNSKINYTYDAAGNLLTSTDPNNRTNSYGYDVVNCFIQTTDTLGNITQYTYDTEGNRVSVTDAKGNTQQYFFDSLNRLIRTQDALNNQLTFNYDPAGNLIAKTDANGNTINYTYDALGRLLKKQYPDLTEETFTYDPRGNMLSCVNSNISYNFNYNALGKLTGVTDSNNQSLSYTYDPTGNKITMSTPENKTITYTYDALNRLRSILDTPGKTTYTYDSLGRRTKTVLPNLTTASYTYDALSRLISLANKTSFHSIISTYAYTYDHAGNKLTKLEPHLKTSYGYDPLYQLTQASLTKLREKDYPFAMDNDNHRDEYEEEDEDDDIEVGCGRNEYDPERLSESYTYDTLGNRLTFQRDTYTYNALNELLSTPHFSYTYDNNGNLIQKTEITPYGIPKSYTYSYDYENRLEQVTIKHKDKTTTISFAYDPLGRRIKKALEKKEGKYCLQEKTTAYCYDNEDIILEYIITKKNNHTQKETLRFLHGPGIDEPISMTKGLSLKGTVPETYYYHFDGLGSVTELTDHHQKVVESYDYDSFGNFKRHGKKTHNSYTLTAREYDPETGLYYYRNRFYDPKAGRFISQDPLGTINGPNLYNYVRNNPINWVDPWGFCKEKLWSEKIQLYLTLVGAEMEKGYMTNMQDIFGLIGVGSGAYANVGLIPKGIGYSNESFIQGGRTAYQWANQYGSGIKYYSFAKLGVRGSALSIGSAIMLGWTVGDAINAYYWGYLDYKEQYK